MYLSEGEGEWRGEVSETFCGAHEKRSSLLRTKKSSSFIKSEKRTMFIFFCMFKIVHTI